MQNLNSNNIVIIESSKNLRALGRNALSGNWKIAILAVLIYTLVIQVPPAILDELFGISLSELFYNNGNFYSSFDADLYATMYVMAPKYSFISGVYTLLVTGSMQLGLSLFFLAMFRRQIVEPTDVFLGFEKFGKALGLFVFQTIFITLWTFLFIVPGIIAAIRYSQAYFIMADDPSKGIRQCMNESKQMMSGNKAKYFCLGLSFIGWALLAIVVSSMIATIGDILGFDGLLAACFSIVGGLAMVPVSVYMYSTFAGFYEILAGHLIKSTEAIPVNQDPLTGENVTGE